MILKIRQAIDSWRNTHGREPAFIFISPEQKELMLAEVENMEGKDIPRGLGSGKIDGIAFVVEGDDTVYIDLREKKECID